MQWHGSAFVFSTVPAALGEHPGVPITDPAPDRADPWRALSGCSAAKAMLGWKPATAGPSNEQTIWPAFYFRHVHQGMSFRVTRCGRGGCHQVSLTYPH